MSIDRRNVRALVRAVAYDVKGARLGRVAQVFLDDRTDEPAWVAVDVTRTRGMRLLPLAGAGLKGKYLVIRADRTTVRSAPRIDLGDGQLSSQEESRLLEHYGLLALGGLQPGAEDQAADYGDQRPATSWPDDTHRGTAWEQPQQRDTAPSPTTAPSPPSPPATPPATAAEARTAATVPAAEPALSPTVAPEPGSSAARV
ncbi:MAG: PRC-barrel domain-containing protein [Geodermatophilaceae bacterium]|nr:PRC-barrel domain-containing protein [Geodermatophilaceae bacterium]